MLVALDHSLHSLRMLMMKMTNPTRTPRCLLTLSQTILMTLGSLTSLLRKAIASGQLACSRKLSTSAQPPQSLNDWPVAEGFRQNTEPAGDEHIPTYLREFHSVFCKESFDELPESKPWDHAVELIMDASPKSCKVYPLSASEQKELDVFLKENLESGRIGPSKSPMASPVFFVKKKDGKLCLVQDYRALNAMTVKNKN